MAVVKIENLSSLRTELINDATGDQQTFYSSNKINDLFGAKQNSLTPGDNITIERDKQTGNLVISASTGSEIKLDDVSGAAASGNKRNVTLTWSDPANKVIDGVTVAEWAGTKIVRKVGSAPSDVSDGTLVADSKVRDQYSSNGYVDNTVTYGSTYYYGFFPYTVDDVTTTGSTVNVTPVKTVISTVPVQNGTVTYDGTEQTASWNNYNTEQLTVTGDIATDAGTYTATFTPTADYMWSDGSTSGVDVNWTINKAAGSVTLSASTVTLNSDNTTATVTVSATGSVTVSSSDTNVAGASVSAGVITITSNDGQNGTAVITVSSAESANYLAASDSIAVTASFLTIATWADGTDEEIAAMIAAADAGEIDLTDYWAVNDKRTVHLSAMTAGSGLYTSQSEQDVVLVLMDTGANSGYKDVNNKTVNFVWGQKNSLSAPGKMNTTATNSGSWNDCAMRADLNSKYYNALPAEFKACLKQFKVITNRTSQDYIQTSQDYISLFAAKEVFGSQSYSNSTEAAALSPIKYYETSSNRIKTCAAYGDNYMWWERSPRSSTTICFCLVSSNGKADYRDANVPAGVAPFGCI